MSVTPSTSSDTPSMSLSTSTWALPASNVHCGRDEGICGPGVSTTGARSQAEIDGGATASARFCSGDGVDSPCGVDTTLGNGQ